MPSTPDYFEKPAKQVGPDYFKKEPTTKISKRHEKDVEKRSGGRRTPGSGNKLGIPGDVDDPIFRRECKATKGGGTQIQAEWLKKISTEALAINKVPLIELRFEGQVEPASKDWVMIPAIEFQGLLEKIKRLEDRG